MRILESLGFACLEGAVMVDLCLPPPIPPDPETGVGWSVHWEDLVARFMTIFGHPDTCDRALAS